MGAGCWYCTAMSSTPSSNTRWLALLGDSAYTAVLWLNRHFNVLRRRLGYQYWSLSAYLKHRVKNAMQYIGSFADAVLTEAHRWGVDGVVCGHIHHAEIREMNGVLYCNDGDWVESCTALVEHYDGHLELIYWTTEERDDELDDEASTMSGAEKQGSELMTVGF